MGPPSIVTRVFRAAHSNGDIDLPSEEAGRRCGRDAGVQGPPTEVNSRPLSGKFSIWNRETTLPDSVIIIVERWDPVGRLDDLLNDPEQESQSRLSNCLRSIP